MFCGTCKTGEKNCRHTFIHAAGAADNDALLTDNLSFIIDIAVKVHLDATAHLSVAGILNLFKDTLGFFLKLVDGVGF